MGLCHSTQANNTDDTEFKHRRNIVPGSCKRYNFSAADGHVEALQEKDKLIRFRCTTIDENGVSHGEVLTTAEIMKLYCQQ